jgi:hypothetical protein
MSCGASSQKFRFQFRRALESEWYSSNPILLEGEPAVSTNTKQIKIGTGARWRDTEYINLAGGVGAAGTPTTLATLIVLTPTSKSGSDITLLSNLTLSQNQAVAFDTDITASETGGNLVRNTVYFVFTSVTNSNVVQVKTSISGTSAY